MNAIMEKAEIRRVLMRDVMELLRAKEQELLKVKRQVEALRIALPLLATEDDPIAAPAMSNKGNGNLS
jgi:hypothetical protein